jgi:lipopolysaccharide export system protein LptA
VSVGSALLTYLDNERKARFEGSVVLRSADTTVSAERADVYLQARGQAAVASGQPAPSQIERIVAEGQIKIRQPNRLATGQKLVYSAGEGKFVMAGGPPSIFDAERGKITGDSLTFYNHDDRVVVDSSSSSPTVTHTRVSK